MNVDGYGRQGSLGTDFFTVVDCVGLQVVANVAHYEKGGNGAQFLAPAVLLLEIPERQTVGTNEPKSASPAARVQVKEGGGGGSHGQILSIQAPIQPLAKPISEKYRAASAREGRGNYLLRRQCEWRGPWPPRRGRTPWCL